MKKIIELEKVFNQAVADLKESFEGLKAELISVDKPELIMHDGKQLKRVEREAEKGDYVRFVKDFGHGTKLGKFYEVIEDERYLDDKGVIFNVYGWEGGRKAVEGVYEIMYETVDRVAGIGERILVTNPIDSFNQYGVGDVFTVSGSYRGQGVFTEELRERFEGDDTFISHNEYEVIIEPEQVSIIKELTANQQRAELIGKAKKFVETHTEKKKLDRFNAPFLSRRGLALIEEFIVNEERRTVVCLLKGAGTNKVWLKGIAKCMPGEVFNKWIGKAIALARALGIDVPEEFLDAVQPDEVVVGMEVSANDSVNEYTVGRFYKEKRLDGEFGEAFFPVGHLMGAWLGVKQVKIINDTNAIYEEELK